MSTKPRDDPDAWSTPELRVSPVLSGQSRIRRRNGFVALVWSNIAIGRTMHRIVLVVALAAAFTFGGVFVGYSVALPTVDEPQGSKKASPFSGDWVANIAKSKRHPNHLFQSATLHFVVDGNTVTLTHAGVNAGGEQESGTVVLQADGMEYPVPGQLGVVVVTKWVGLRLLQTVGTSAGATVGGASYEVSPDGTTLTATVSGIDASGKRFQQVIVFDRK